MRHIFITALVLSLVSCSKQHEKNEVITRDLVSATIGVENERFYGDLNRIGGLINEYYLQNGILPPLGTKRLADAVSGDNKARRNYLIGCDFTISQDGVFLIDTIHRIHAYVTASDEIVVVLEGEEDVKGAIHHRIEQRFKLMQLPDQLK